VTEARLDGADDVAEVQVDCARLELPPDPLVETRDPAGRGEISPTSGSPAAASRSQGCGPPTSTQVGCIHATPARGSTVFPCAFRWP
jgi:hypothetical protein